MDGYLCHEVVLYITDLISDPDTLAALRLVSRSWSQAATKRLKGMKDILYIDWCEKTQKPPMERLSQYRTMAPECRSLIVKAPYYACHQKSLSLWVATACMCQFCYNHLSQLADFIPDFVSKRPHLRHLALHFRPVKEKARRTEISHIEKKAAADKMLACIRNVLVHNQELEQLSIQNVPIYARYAWHFGRPHRRYQNFYWQTHKLASLKIGYVDMDIGKPQNQKIRLTGSERKELFEKITPPIPTHAFTLHLRHLSISCWGFYGRRGEMELPRFQSLKSLEFRGVAFTSSYDLTWIEAHSLNLRSLVLIDCAIIYRLELKRQSIEGSFNGVKVVPNDQKGVQHYKMRWHDWFKVFRTNLNLENFQIGSNRVRAAGEKGPVFESESKKGPGFQETPQFLFGLFPDRYLMMNEGNCKTPWKLECPSGPQKSPPQCDLKDLTALSKLMHRIGQFVEGDATSSHAGYVKKWMGHVKPKK